MTFWERFLEELFNVIFPILFVMIVCYFGTHVAHAVYVGRLTF